MAICFPNFPRGAHKKFPAKMNFKPDINNHVIQYAPINTGVFYMLLSISRLLKLASSKSFIEVGAVLV